ncbi:diphthine synthase [Candidatus Woesearchaeota archaeon]|nr:diphthine synthase [Candidatus Woesearchaeota archaeon]
MTLFMIGLGLNNEKDITVNGLEAVKRSDFVYLEDYTSRLNCSEQDLEKFYSKKIILADRELVEKKADEILDEAIKKNVAFLVIGDVFSATTHIDLYLRAKEKNIEIKVINNTSILNAVGIAGLELYKYGKTTSLPFFEKSFRPETPYDVIKDNKKLGLHTLILLDIKKDQNKFMTVSQAVEQLLRIEKKRRKKVFTEDTMIIGCARIGSDDFKIKFRKSKELLNEDFGEPLHCLVIPGKLHFMEEKMLELWK